MEYHNPIKSVHVFILLAIFWLAWIYNEVDSREHRQASYEEVREFMSRGDRFTKHDGELLELRIQVLEQYIRDHQGHSGKYTEKIINVERDFMDLRNEIIRLQDQIEFNVDVNKK